MITIFICQREKLNLSKEIRTLRRSKAIQRTCNLYKIVKGVFLLLLSFALLDCIIPSKTIYFSNHHDIKIKFSKYYWWKKWKDTLNNQPAYLRDFQRNIRGTNSVTSQTKWIIFSSQCQLSWLLWKKGRQNVRLHYTTLN